jgi:phosphonate transport system ATP-binding protein
VADQPILQIRDLSHIYSENKQALDRVTLLVERGERIGLIGPSGAGKSTLLRTINGLVVPTSGVINVLGEDVRSLNEAGLRNLRRHIGMVFQEFALIDRLPVLTNVLVGRLGYTATLPSLFRAFSKEDVARARQALSDVGLEGTDERLVRELSGGQRQRVGIARSLVQETPLILGDEPTANLDVRTADEILALLVRLAEERSSTLLLSLHDVRSAKRYCTRIVALRDGRIVWDGPAERFGESEVEQVFY